MAFIQRNTFGFGFLFFLLSIFILISHATSFDITKMLSQQQDFSSFSNLLTQTQVASQINSRQTITVLALDNSAVSQISGKPSDVLKKILEVHVILDYYDVQKLQKLSNKTALLTTLFQASGQANGPQQGFVNVTDTESGKVAFGSAVAGSSLNANLVKSVVSQPYNISVLQISSPILPPGIDQGSSKSAGTAQLTSPPTGAPPPTSTTPSPSPQKSKTPTPSSAPSSASGDDGSTPPTSADAPTGDAPTVSSPASAPSDAPVVGSPLADGPIAADGPAAAETTADSSDGGRLGGGFGILFIISTLLIDIGIMLV